MLADQGGGCAVCATTKPGGRGTRFHVDHDRSCCPTRHSCGRCIRALLCSRCNRWLGAMRDDPALIRRALEYLEVRQ